GRFLEVETLEEVERCEREQQKESQLKRAKAPAVEIVGTDEQHDRDRNRQGMKETQLLYRLDLQQQVPAPARVRRQGREQIDQRDRRRSHGDQQRERVRTPKAAQREWGTMQSQPP